MSSTRPAGRASGPSNTFITGLTACAGTWLADPPEAEERARIAAARREIQGHRAAAEAFAADPDTANRFSLQLFGDPRFAPLHFSNQVVEEIIGHYGEPPVVERDDDPAFSDYLRSAVRYIATGRVRRAMSGQLARFLPQYIEAGDIDAALAIEHNIYLTNMSEAVTPLLAQMMVAALARWYEEHEEESA